MSNIERLRAAIRYVSPMLDDPHPGLSSWHMILRDNAISLRDLLLELYPTEPSKELDEVRAFFKEHGGRIVFTERANELSAKLVRLDIGYLGKDTLR